MSRRKKRKQRPSGLPPPKAQESASGEVGVQRAERGTGLWKKIAVLAAIAVVIPVAAVSACLVLARSGEPAGPPRAVIVDQLSLTFPNPDFVQEATDTLEEAGYIVDYYAGEEVTIDLYRDLPTRGYDYVILRVHSARFNNVWRGRAYDEPVLFTSELYSPALYIPEQWEMRLNPAYAYEGATRYFAIAANFVESSMVGEFDDATVILMGCDGLSTDRTAEAFIEKGAGSVIGWSDFVSSDHTDAATERLLEHLVVGGLSVEEAVAQTVAEVGSDPVYETVLLSYPPKG